MSRHTRSPASLRHQAMLLSNLPIGKRIIRTQLRLQPWVEKQWLDVNPIQKGQQIRRDRRNYAPSPMRYNANAPHCGSDLHTTLAQVCTTIWAHCRAFASTMRFLSAPRLSSSLTVIPLTVRQRHRAIRTRDVATLVLHATGDNSQCSRPFPRRLRCWSARELSCAGPALAIVARTLANPFRTALSWNHHMQHMQKCVKQHIAMVVKESATFRPMRYNAVPTSGLTS